LKLARNVIEGRLELKLGSGRRETYHCEGDKNNVQEWMKHPEGGEFTHVKGLLGDRREYNEMDKEGLGKKKTNRQNEINGRKGGIVESSMWRINSEDRKRQEDIRGKSGGSTRISTRHKRQPLRQTRSF